MRSFYIVAEFLLDDLSQKLKYYEVVANLWVLSISEIKLDLRFSILARQWAFDSHWYLIAIHVSIKKR